MFINLLLGELQDLKDESNVKSAIHVAQLLGVSSIQVAHDESHLPQTPADISKKLVAHA